MQFLHILPSLVLPCIHASHDDLILPVGQQPQLAERGKASAHFRPLVPCLHGGQAGQACIDGGTQTVYLSARAVVLSAADLGRNIIRDEIAFRSILRCDKRICLKREGNLEDPLIIQEQGVGCQLPVEDTSLMGSAQIPNHRLQQRKEFLRRQEASLLIRWARSAYRKPAGAPHILPQYIQSGLPGRCLSHGSQREEVPAGPAPARPGAENRSWLPDTKIHSGGQCKGRGPLLDQISEEKTPSPLPFPRTDCPRLSIYWEKGTS